MLWSLLSTILAFIGYRLQVIYSNQCKSLPFQVLKFNTEDKQQGAVVFLPISSNRFFYVLFVAGPQSSTVCCSYTVVFFLYHCCCVFWYFFLLSSGVTVYSDFFWSPLMLFPMLILFHPGNWAPVAWISTVMFHLVGWNPTLRWTITLFIYFFLTVLSLG